MDDVDDEMDEMDDEMDEMDDVGGIGILGSENFEWRKSEFVVKPNLWKN